MTIFKRMLYIIMILALASTALAQEAVESAAPEISADGAIRVYLKSLGEPEALYLTLAGEYVIEGSQAMRFERGTDVVVTSEEGCAYITVGGLTLSMGAEFTLTRCAAGDGEENGLYIHESERHALYEGDLRVFCSGSGLGCVLTISMEDYLCGVVAYEMSDSFPLEALKAQAVAARTYAVSRRSVRTGDEYDVTDTTGDQVFKGYVADYANVETAVAETAGIVGVYNGDYAACFYTASNGGQTATPNQIWGGEGDYGYIRQKDDPYDLENARSLVNSFEIPAAHDDGNALWRMIDEKLDRSGHDEVRADGIIAMELNQSAYEGSRMYRNLDITLALSARDVGFIETFYEGDARTGWAMGYIRIGTKWYMWGLKDWKSLEITQTVSFSVYDEIKDGLGVGLNSSDYELASIAENDTGYAVEFRRFGHGVGMSQRGAQVMAGDYGKSYIEILEFYYPGMELIKIAWDFDKLPEMARLPAALARERLLIPPTESELGALAEGEYFARVSLESAKSRLNVRAEPSTEAMIIAKLDDGYRVVVCEDVGDGWARIRGGSFSGYIKAEYITAE